MLICIFRKKWSWKEWINLTKVEQIDDYAWKNSDGGISKIDFAIFLYSDLSGKVIFFCKIL